MKLNKLAGATSEIWQIFIADNTSTTGAGLPGVLFNAAGLTCYYHRDTDTTATVVTLVTMTVGTFTSSGFKEIDATNMPGWYQFCPPNAALASGAKSVAFHLKGAASMAPLPIEVQLTAVNPDSATAFMTSVASVVGAVGSVTGLTASNLDAAISTRMATYTQPTGFLAAAFPGTVASPTNITAASGVALTAAYDLAKTAAQLGDVMKVSSGTGANQINLSGGNLAGSVASVVGNVGGSTASIGPNGLDAAALATDAVTEIVTAIFARAFSAAYGSYTFDQIIKIILAVEAGKVSGLDVGAPAFRNIADNGNVVVATTDVDGNRSVVTITP